jgi:signal transduction histidine kinase/FixJ family two-component response regulator
MSSRRPTVLLVEDNPDDADTLRELFVDANARVELHWVETLAAGLLALKERSVDLILLDLSLPDSQGLDTVRRALAAAPELPILVLTGLEDDGLGTAAVHAGAQDYLVKGQGDGATLMRCMRYATERHRLLAARTADATVWAALARSGEALLATAGGPGVPQALCTVARDALDCVSTSTWMLDRAGSSFVPVAALPRREWHRIADLSAPREALAPLAAGGEAVRWMTAPLRRALPPGLTVGDETLLFVFARGDELIAVQACGYAQRPTDDSVTMRIARGLVHVAGMALANARLVDALERSNSVKTYFAATMSHELRNTLFAISGFGDMLGDQFAGAPDGEPARLARAIGGRARDSLAMIQAALELTRSEVRPTNDESGALVAAELIERLAAETRVPTDKPELQLEWDVPPGLPPLRCDAIKLGMVLKNLVTNALKFTERGLVRVAVEPVEGALRFVVSDTGIGIDAGELPHLFEPFHQAHGARSRRAGGAGLGCYIVSRLVEMIGGQLAVDSQPNVGTRFAVTVPLEPGC